MEQRESIGFFGDPRRAERGAAIFERIVALGSLTVRKIGANRAGEMGVHRFLSSPEVTTQEIIETASARTAAGCAGRRVVAVQDTSEINFRGRDRGRKGLGRGGDGEGKGFFLHPVIAIDAEDEAVLGLLDAQIWTRGTDDDGTACRDRRNRNLEDKESRRWLAGARAAAQRAADAAQLIVVSDRESDIYALFAQRPESAELVVRAARDRAVDGGGLLFAQAETWAVLDSSTLRLPARRPGEVARTAEIALRAGEVQIKRPRYSGHEHDPASIALTLVEAFEVAPPEDVPPVHWRLLTTLPVKDAAAARDIIALYRLRWRIEQTFRALKSDGLGLPDVQMQEAGRLFKLAALGLAAAVRTIQLVDARDGGPRPASDVAD
jgi:DDE family transposase